MDTLRIALGFFLVFSPWSISDIASTLFNINCCKEKPDWLVVKATERVGKKRL